MSRIEHEDQAADRMFMVVERDYDGTSIHCVTTDRSLADQIAATYGKEADVEQIPVARSLADAEASVQYQACIYGYDDPEQPTQARGQAYFQRRFDTRLTEIRTSQATPVRGAPWWQVYVTGGDWDAVLAAARSEALKMRPGAEIPDIIRPAAPKDEDDFTESRSAQRGAS